MSTTSKCTSKCVEFCFGTHDRARITLRAIIWTTLTAIIVWQGWEISKRQQAVRDSNERLFRIFHGSPVATIMCDERGIVLEYNRTAEDLFGWEPKEVIGKPVDVLLAPDSRTKHEEAFRLAAEKLRAIDEDWKITKQSAGIALGKDGREIPVTFFTRGIRYGGRIEFLATIRRVAPNKAVESGPIDFPKKATP